MSLDKIVYDGGNDKVDLETHEGILGINKVMAYEYNMIKDVVNDAIDYLEALDSSQIAHDDTSQKVVTGTTVEEAIESIDTALLNARATGLRFGGALTDLGSGVVRISAGSGQILDNSNPASPLYYNVSWSQTDIDFSGATDGEQNFIYVDNTGSVEYSTDKPEHYDYRNRIYLHRAVFRSGLLTGTLPIPVSIQQYASEIRDIQDILGVTKHEDEMIINKGTGDYQIAISSGAVYASGANFYNDPTNPNEIAISSANPLTFRHVLRDNTQSADATALDVSNYDNAGVITAMSNNKWAIYTLFVFPNENYRALRPQTEYGSYADARKALFDGQYLPVTPTNFKEAFRVGWIIFEKNDTLVNADFITTGKFGGIAGSISTIGGGYIAELSEVGGEASIIKDAQEGILKTLKAGTGITITENSDDVEISADGGGITDAPSDGTAYGRQDGAWENVIQSDDVYRTVVLTQAAYDALTPDANTQYLIVG